jgi:cobalt-zinc-cadmium efflux system outer membrane protein
MKYMAALLIILASAVAHGQQLLSLNAQQVDSLFLQHNLILLAQQYNIDTQEALIIQSKTYPNPIFTADINAIDPQNNKEFHVGNTGQKAFSIEQLILLGGKRKVEIDMARQNKKIAELEFDDLLRNLNYQLRGSFFSLYRQKSVLQKFDRQLQVLDTLIASYETQAKRGNLPLKDVIRLKSVYLKINNDKSELATENFNEQRKMQQLIQSADYIDPVVSDQDFEAYNTPQDFESMKEVALENRPDLKISYEQSALALLNVRLQKSLAVPDMALNSSYDQRGGAFLNQVNVGVSIPLPVWNLNRGNIKAAQFNEKSSQLFQQQKKTEVETDVRAAWQNMNLSITEYNKVKQYYSDEFDIIFRGVNDNFQKRNISILEFVDFFESYNESLSEYERVKNFLANSAMQINYVTASKIY